MRMIIKLLFCVVACIVAGLNLSDAKTTLTANTPIVGLPLAVKVYPDMTIDQDFTVLFGGFTAGTASVKSGKLVLSRVSMKKLNATTIQAEVRDLTIEDNGKALLFQSTKDDETARYTISFPECPRIVSGQSVIVKSSNGDFCGVDQYYMQGCTTTFVCEGGTDDEGTVSTCAKTDKPKWSTPLPTNCKEEAVAGSGTRVILSWMTYIGSVSMAVCLRFE